MSEESKQVVDGQETVEKKDATHVEAEVTTELSPVEQQALEQGWVPQDQWEGDPEQWRPAKEFVDRGELYKSIHTTKRELKQTQAALTTMQRHHQMVFEKAYNKALADLRQERRLAMREQDFDRVEAVEDKIQELNTERQQEAAQIAATQAVINAPTINPQFQSFLDKNPWYAEDTELRAEADALGAGYMSRPDADRNKLLEHVEEKIKKLHPEKFGMQRKVAAPSAVAAVDRTGKKPTKGVVSMSDVPEEMRSVIRNFVETTGMSEQDYIKELKRIGAL